MKQGETVKIRGRRGVLDWRKSEKSRAARLRIRHVGWRDYETQCQLAKGKFLERRAVFLGAAIDGEHGNPSHFADPGASLRFRSPLRRQVINWGIGARPPQSVRLHFGMLRRITRAEYCDMSNDDEDSEITITRR